MTTQANDPRSVANLMLDQASQREIVLHHLSLQKLLYFGHGIFLTAFRKPLVSGYFEAWQYGPVHPAVYHAFKAAGDRPIDFRAVSRNPLTGRERQISPPVDPDVHKVVDRVLLALGELSPGRLVEISHARGAPWDTVVNEAETTMAFGLRIPDNAIVARFRFHKVAVGTEPPIGEPREDLPFTEP
jgi:uncharacterized phage-associated protein